RNGNGTFATATTFASGDIADIALADMDSDSFLDIVTAGNGNEGGAILLNDGTGSFGAPIVFGPQSANAEALSVIVADFNQDGAPDIAVTVRNLNRIDVFLANP